MRRRCGRPRPAVPSAGEFLTAPAPPRRRRRIDEDNSNEVSLEEFYGFMKLERSPWMDRVFTIMGGLLRPPLVADGEGPASRAPAARPIADEDQSGEIDFREFVVCCWNYCSFDMLSLVTFAFNMFDLDGSGELERVRGRVAGDAARCGTSGVRTVAM